MAADELPLRFGAGRYVPMSSHMLSISSQAWQAMSRVTCPTTLRPPLWRATQLTSWSRLATLATADSCAHTSRDLLHRLLSAEVLLFHDVRSLVAIDRGTLWGLPAAAA